MTQYFEFDSNSDEFAKLVRERETLLFRVANNRMNELKERWITAMKNDHFTGYYPGATKGKKLRTRHGALKQSIGGRVSGKKLGTLRAVLRAGGGAAGYAATQEYGDPSRTSSRADGYMRIPIGAPKGKALTPTGRMRAKAVPRPTGEMTKKGHPIYETGFGRTFVVKSGGKLFVLARPKGHSGRGKFKGNVLLFILKQQVKIKPRLEGFEELERVSKQVGEKMHVQFGNVLRLRLP